MRGTTPRTGALAAAGAQLPLSSVGVCVVRQVITWIRQALRPARHPGGDYIGPASIYAVREVARRAADPAWSDPAERGSAGPATA